MGTIEFLFTPLVACLLLIIINVYFGIHVIKREIIFIDIALAQIAVMGSTIGWLIYILIDPESAHHHEESNAFTYLFSIIFISIAAGIFTFLKSKKIPVPLEAIIGITYAVATTGTVIILDKAAGGDVHVHDMLVGSIFWVSWHQITRLFVIILFVGFLHIIYRRKFTKLSDDYNNKISINQGIWDFLFYLSFGIVVVEAVNIAGILLIFAFLIIPASISTLFFQNWWTKIWFGWGLSFLIAFLGLFISWKFDTPSSPMIILILAIVLLTGFIIKKTLKLKEI